MTGGWGKGQDTWDGTELLNGGRKGGGGGRVGGEGRD